MKKKNNIVVYNIQHYIVFAPYISAQNQTCKKSLEKPVSNWNTSQRNNQNSVFVFFYFSFQARCNHDEFWLFQIIIWYIFNYANYFLSSDISFSGLSYFSVFCCLRRKKALESCLFNLLQIYSFKRKNTPIFFLFYCIILNWKKILVYLLSSYEIEEVHCSRQFWTNR